MKTQKAGQAGFLFDTSNAQLFTLHQPLQRQPGDPSVQPMP
jgi:hypothetical protein